MTHSYKFFCTRESLKGIREFVEGTLKIYFLSEILINQLILAVDEVCSNLIIHAHKCNPDDSLELTIENTNHDIYFEIKDKNDLSFDWNTYQEPDIQDIVKSGKKGGVGLKLVNSVMDDVMVKQENEGSVWRLHKIVNVMPVNKSARR